VQKFQGEAPLRAEIQYPKKVHFSGSKLACNSKPLVDQRRNVPSSYFFPILDMLPRSGDIRGQSRKWSKIDRNFACFWPQFFLGGAPPKFLEWDYKIQPDSDHVARFQGDRSRELGERVAKKEKKEKDTSRLKHKPVRNSSFRAA